MDINKAPLIRASGLAAIMTDPKTIKAKEAGEMSETAKSYCLQLAKEAHYGVQFPLENKYLTKGIECEDESIALLSEYLGIELKKHQGRMYKDGLTGECDLLCESDGVGYDVKTAYSLETFPCLPFEVAKRGYEWQMRAYMALYDCHSFSVAYCLVDTPVELLTYVKPDEMDLHIGHGLKKLSDRITILKYERCLKEEAKIFERVAQARAKICEYMDMLLHKESVK